MFIHSGLPACLLILWASPQSCFFTLAAVVPSVAPVESSLQFFHQSQNKLHWIHLHPTHPWPQRHHHQPVPLPQRFGSKTYRTPSLTLETPAPAEQHSLLSVSVSALWSPSSNLLSLNASNFSLCSPIPRGGSFFLQSYICGMLELSFSLFSHLGNNFRPS